MSAVVALPTKSAAYVTGREASFKEAFVKRFGSARSMSSAQANEASAWERDFKAGYDRSYDAASAKARVDERKRLQAILTSTQGQAHPDLAKHLAFETNMTADEALAMLGKTPKAGAGRPRDRLDAALAEMGRGDGADADGAYGRGRAIVARVKGRTGNDN